MNEPLNAKVAKQAKARTVKANYFDDPKTTMSPQKQDTGLNIPPDMPKSFSKKIDTMYKDNPEQAKQFTKNLSRKLDNRY